MRDSKGRFTKGHIGNPSGQFKKGEQRRWEKKPYWDKNWFENEYINKKRSMLDIANQFGVTENAINYWAKKHGTKTRTMGEIRAIKYWGNSGDSNPMYGKRGEDTPNWKGGVTPMRQEFYRSERWTVAVKAVWKRDAGVCQRCGKKWEHIGKKFHIHHKCSFAIGLETRCDPDNLVLLCQYCHNWVHSSKNTERLFIND